MKSLNTIKKAFDPLLINKGFSFIGYVNQAWRYIKHQNDAELTFSINKIKGQNEIWLEFTRCSKYELLNLRVEELDESIPKEERHDTYASDETFRQAILHQAYFLNTYFLPVLDKISKSRYKWNIEAGQHQNFYRKHKQYLIQIKSKYKIDRMEKKELLPFIENVFKSICLEEKEIYENTVFELAALFGQTVMENKEGCHWKWFEEEQKCMLMLGEERCTIKKVYWNFVDIIHSLELTWQLNKMSYITREFNKFFIDWKNIAV